MINLDVMVMQDYRVNNEDILIDYLMNNLKYTHKDAKKNSKW